LQKQFQSANSGGQKRRIKKALKVPLKKGPGETGVKRNANGENEYRWHSCREGKKSQEPGVCWYRTKQSPARPFLAHRFITILLKDQDPSKGQISLKTTTKEGKGVKEKNILSILHSAGGLYSFTLYGLPGGCLTPTHLANFSTTGVPTVGKNCAPVRVEVLENNLQGGLKGFPKRRQRRRSLASWI